MSFGTKNLIKKGRTEVITQVNGLDVNFLFMEIYGILFTCRLVPCEIFFLMALSLHWKIMLNQDPVFSELIWFQVDLSLICWIL